MIETPEARELADDVEARVTAAAREFLGVLQTTAREINPRDLPREHLQIVLTLGFQSVYREAMLAFRPDDEAPDAYHATMFETAIIGLGLSVGAVFASIPEGPARSGANRTFGEAVSSEMERVARENRLAAVAAAKGDAN